MRLFLLGLILTLGLLALLTLAGQQLGTFRFRPKHQRELEEAIGVRFSDSEDKNKIENESNTSNQNLNQKLDDTDNRHWFCKLIGLKTAFLGCQSKSEREKIEHEISRRVQKLLEFDRVGQDYLNKSESINDHLQLRSKSTDGHLQAALLPPPQLSADKEVEANSTVNGKRANDSTEQLINGTQTDDEGREFKGIKTIDKIRGIDDLSSTSLATKSGANEEEGEKMSKGKMPTTTDGQSGLQKREKQRSASKTRCQSSDYDRLIGEKINQNELSRPIVNPDGRFENPFPTWVKPTYADLILFMLETNDANVPRSKNELDKELPLIKPKFVTDRTANAIDYKVTWIGHSSLLIQVDGFNILTDPMFSCRASPSQYFGPKRIREPACGVEDLPKIDIVLISHNHYDHLDEHSVKSINDRFGSECRWIVPLGLGEFMDSMSVINYVELDWWQKDCFQLVKGTGTGSSTANKTLPREQDSSNSNKPDVEPKEHQVNEELSIYLTPAQHWSRRSVSDVNKSLWGSYAIVSSKNATFFFAGDTGYCRAFKEIAQIFAPFTGAAIPIGAYKPRWFLKAQHVDPSEAIQIHKDLGSLKSIAIHHSTFILGKEFYKEPPSLLRQLVHEQKIEKPFIVLKHGESSEFNRRPTATV